MKTMLSAFSLANERLIVTSGNRQLSAVYVSAGTETPAILICHGIGERVEYWGGVQVLLREMGVSSLVFNYSGYGTSSGTFSTTHCEEDAVAAYGKLVAQGHPFVVLLGFSLGSGVGCAVASSIDLDGLVLCEGFSTLREAGIAMGFPQWMARAAPNVWDTVHRVGELEMPVLVVHSDKDDLFPMPMAERVAEACRPHGRLIVINGLSHDAPYRDPSAGYWPPIVEWVKERSAQVSERGLPVASD